MSFQIYCHIGRHHVTDEFTVPCCCDMGQNDTIGKIELKIIFRLAVGISNSRNDIQLFLQLFDELRVNGDYH